MTHFTQEMQKVAPPLTGIHTPIKGAPSVFAFHRNGVQVSENNYSISRSVVVETNEKAMANSAVVLQC